MGVSRIRRVLHGLPVQGFLNLHHAGVARDEVANALSIHARVPESGHLEIDKIRDDQTNIPLEHKQKVQSLGHGKRDQWPGVWNDHLDGDFRRPAHDRFNTREAYSVMMERSLAACRT